MTSASFEHLPDELMITILSDLPLKYVLNVLETSSTLNRRLNPYFEREIDLAYQEHQKSCEAFMRTIEDEIVSAAKLHTL